jgi:hypothetical protein
MVVDNYLIQLFFIAAINFLAAFLQAVSGFGYAMVAMTLMPFVLPMRYCSAISAATVVAIGIQMVIILRKNIDLKVVALPIISAFFTINLGIFLLMTFEDSILKLILAGLIFFLTGFFFYCQKNRIELKKTTFNSVFFGLLTGITTGMYNIVGPFFLVYYMNITNDTLTFKASMEFSFLMAGLYSSVRNIMVGNISSITLPFILASICASLIAGTVGIRIFKRIDRNKITMMIYILLPLLAIMLLIKN